MSPTSEPMVTPQIVKLKDVEGSTLLNLQDAVAILRKGTKGGKPQTVTELIEQLYPLELTLTCPSTENDSIWDSFFSAIIQIVLCKYNPDEMQELTPCLASAYDGGKKLAIKLDILFNETKRTCALKNAKDNLFAHPQFTEHARKLLTFVATNLATDVTLWHFDWKSWTLKELLTPTPLNSNNKHVPVILTNDTEQNVIRSIIPLNKIDSSNIEEYCENLLNYSIERQEMTLDLTETFDKIKSEDFQGFVEKKLENLKEIKTISEFASKIFDTSKPLVSLQHLSKYEGDILALGDEDDTIGQILQELKVQFVHNMNSASQHVLMARLAEHREKVRLLQEREEQLVVENDRLEQVMEEAEAEKKRKEEELRKLEDELKKAKGDKKRLEELIAKKKAELEETARKLKTHKENMAWNAFKKDLMELQVSYENLKRGSDVGDLTKITLLNGCKKILEKFPLKSISTAEVRESLYGFAQRSDTAGNREQVAGLVRFLFEPPVISFNPNRNGILEVKGRQILLSDVLKKVSGHKFTEIRIVAGTTLYVDADMTNDTYHGRNVVLVAPLLDVVKDVTINTSGLHGTPTSIPAKAPDGNGPGRSGYDGADAQAGESAGNVFIQGNEMKNSQRLKIIANGGNGGQGQDGGHGKTGENGYNGQNGDVGDGYSWTGTCNYRIQFGTDGLQGNPGGSGGNAGLGGGAGAKAEINLSVPNCKANTQSQPGKQGRDGNAGSGANGGTGGYNGADHGVAWHNQAFAGGYYVYKRGKLDVRKQNVWYGGNGWDLIVLRSESDIRNSRAMNGQHGRNGQSAASRANQRKTSSSKSKVFESEIIALSLSVQSQFTNSNLGAERAAASKLAAEKKAIEAQESQLKKDKKEAEVSKQKVEEHIKQTEQEIQKTEKQKADLEALIAKSAAEMENNKSELEKLAQTLKQQQASLSSVKAAENASQNVAQVIQSHQRAERAEALEQTTHNQASRMKDFDDTAPTSGKHVTAEVISQETEEKERIKGLYDEVRGMKDLDKLSDEFFAIALASRVPDSELSSSIEIGMEAIKSASVDGNSFPQFTRTFLQKQCENLEKGSKQESELSSKYLREKMPQDTLVASRVHSWAENNPHVLQKIQRACGGHFTGSAVGQYFVYFRTSRDFQSARSIEKVHKAIGDLRKKKKLETVEAQMIVDHLELILVDHMQSWFLEQCKAQKLSEEAVQQIERLLWIVNTIYSDIREFIPELSLHQTYKDFLNIVESAKSELQQEKLWESVVLQLTGLSTTSPMLSIDKTFKSLAASIESNKQPNTEIPPDVQRQFSILKYVISQLHFQPDNLDHLITNWINLASILPTSHRCFRTDVLELRQVITLNYVKKHQVPKIELINSYLKDSRNNWNNTLINKVLDKLSRTISNVEGPFSQFSFGQRLDVYAEFYSLLTQEEKTEEEVLSKLSGVLPTLYPYLKQSKTNVEALCLEFANCLTNFKENSSKTTKKNKRGAGSTEETYKTLLTLCSRLRSEVNHNKAALMKLNDILSGFFLKFASNLGECPFVITQLIETLQSAFVSEWLLCLNDTFSELVKVRTEKMDLIDAKIEEILEAIRIVVEDSTEVLNRDEFIVIAKVHLLKIANGWLLFNKSGNILEKALSVLEKIQQSLSTDNSKGLTALAFVKHTGEILNRFTLEIPFEVKSDIDEVKKTSATVKCVTDVEYCRAVLNSCVETLQKSPDSTDAVIDTLTQLTSLKIHGAPIYLEMFGVDEQKPKENFKSIYALMEHIFSTENDETFLAIRPAVKELGTVLSAADNSDCFTLCRFINEKSSAASSNFEKNVQEIQMMCKDALKTIFAIWSESGGGVLTYAEPVNHFMAEITNKIIPALDSSNMDSMVEKLYLDCCIKYFGHKSMPTLPTEVRASLFHLTSGKNEFSRVFTAFQSGLSTGKDKTWAIPFLSVFKEFLRLIPADFPTSCLQVHDLCLRVSETSLNDGGLDKRIIEKLGVVIDELVAFCGDVCRGDIIKQAKDAKENINCLKSLEKMEFAFWAMRGNNPDFFSKTVLTHLYSEFCKFKQDDSQEIKRKVLELFQQQLAKSTTLKIDFISAPDVFFDEALAQDSPSKLTEVALAVFILNSDLNPLEMSFCRRIFNAQQVLKWTATEAQKEKFKSIKDTEGDRNRLMQIILTDLKIKDKQIQLSFLNNEEQNVLLSLMNLVTAEEYDLTLNGVRDILEGYLENEWRQRFQDLFSDAQFRRIIFLYGNPVISNFGGLLWDKPGKEDTTPQPGKIQVERFLKEFDTFNSSHYEHSVNNESLLLISREIDLELSPKESILNFAEQVIKFKHLFNRCYYFSQSSEISEWFGLLYQRCKLRRPHLSELNDLLTRSVELSPAKLIRIAHKTNFDTWMETILSQIVLQNVETLKNQIHMSSQQSGAATEDVVLKPLDMEKDLAKCKSGFWKNRLMAIFADKLQEEIQCASESMPMDIKILKQVFLAIGNHSEVDKQLVMDLLKPPLSRWPKTFKEHKLLKSFDKPTTNSILKFEELFGALWTTRMLKVLESHVSEVGTFLNNFNRLRWHISNSLLEKLEAIQKEDVSEKLAELKVTCQIFSDEFKNRKRDTVEIARIMAEESKNSGISAYLQRNPISAEPNAPLEKNCKLERLVDKVKSTTNSALVSELSTPISTWSVSDIVKWKLAVTQGARQERMDRIQSNISEVIKVLCRALEIFK